MPKVVAKIVHEYAKKMRAPGDEYEVEERHLDILRKLGRVDLAPTPAPKTSATARDGAGETYRTTNIETAPEQKTAPKRTRQRESLIGARRP